MPTDIIYDSPRVATYAEADPEAVCQDALDLIDEVRDLALSHSSIYQQNLRHNHKWQMCGRSFNEGDLVL